jgi:hypothetical protein
MIKDKTQLDRIERKLDAVLAFRDALLKLAMPRIPAGMREQAMKLAAGLQPRD